MTESSALFGGAFVCDFPAVLYMRGVRVVVVVVPVRVLHALCSLACHCVRPLLSFFSSTGGQLHGSVNPTRQLHSSPSLWVPSRLHPGALNDCDLHSANGRCHRRVNRTLLPGCRSLPLPGADAPVRSRSRASRRASTFCKTGPPAQPSFVPSRAPKVCLVMMAFKTRRGHGTTTTHVSYPPPRIAWYSSSMSSRVGSAGAQLPTGAHARVVSV